MHSMLTIEDDCDLRKPIEKISKVTFQLGIKYPLQERPNLYLSNSKLKPVGIFL